MKAVIVSHGQPGDPGPQQRAVEDLAARVAACDPGCPVAGEMPGWVADAVNALPGVRQVDVEMTFQPPWGMEMMSDEARLELGFM